MVSASASAIGRENTMTGSAAFRISRRCRGASASIRRAALADHVLHERVITRRASSWITRDGSRPGCSRSISSSRSARNGTARSSGISNRPPAGRHRGRAPRRRCRRPARRPEPRDPPGSTGRAGSGIVFEDRGRDAALGIARGRLPSRSSRGPLCLTSPSSVSQARFNPSNRRSAAPGGSRCAEPARCDRTRHGPPCRNPAPLRRYGRSRCAEVVAQRQGLRQILVEPQRAGERPAIWLTSRVWVSRVR